MKTNQSRRPGLALPLALAIVTGATAQAAWQIDPDFRPLPTFGFVVPTITAIQPDGKVIFDGGRKRWNADGSIDPTFSSPNDQPRGLWIGPAGQLIARSNSVYSALTPTGATIGLGSTVNGSSSAAGFMADGRFYIVGSFSQVSGVFRPGVARLHPDGNLDTSFDPGSGVDSSFPNLVGAVQSDGKLLLAGTFSSFSGIIRAQLLRLNLDGTVDLGFDAGSPILGGNRAIAVDAQDRVFVAGSGAIRRLAADGSNAVLLNTAMSGAELADVWSLYPRADGSIGVQGGFTRIGTHERTWGAVLNEDGSVAESFDIGWLTAGLSRPTRQSLSKLLFGPSHVYLQLDSGELVRLLPDGRVDPLFVLPAETRGRAVVTSATTDSNGRTLFAGRFTHVDEIVRPGFARVTGDGAIDATFNPESGPHGEVRTMAWQPDGKVLVGGRFDAVGGDRRTAIARFHADGTFDHTFDAQLNDDAVVEAIVVQSDGAIVVGGNFSAVGSTPRARLARLMPDGSDDPSFLVTTGITGQNPALTKIELLDGDRLLIAGTFDAYNGARRWGVARLLSNGSLDTTFDPGSTTAGWQINEVSAATDDSVALSAVGASGSIIPTIGALDSAGQSRYTRSGSTVLLAPTVAPVLAEPGGAMLGAAQRFNFGTLDRFGSTGERDGATSIEFSIGNPLVLARETGGSVLVAGDFIEVDGMAYAGLMRLLPVTTVPRLTNISTRGYVGTNHEILIAGFYVAGDEPQRVLIRGIAKHLLNYGVTGVATKPTISLYRQGESAPIASNVLWYNSVFGVDERNNRFIRTFERVGAFPLGVYWETRLPRSDGCALLVYLPAGAYTVHLTAESPGIGLVEVYDANGVGAVRKLINISTRGRVGLGEEKLIAGFVISEGTKRVLIRAVGPAIAGFLPGTLADPMIELVRQSDSVTLATNDNWSDAGNAAEIATITPQVTGLPLAQDSGDAALLVDLPAGAYTVLASGVGDTTGIALVEVYEVP